MRQLLEAIIEIQNASSDDATRYTLSGVCLDDQNGKLRLRATNGHILASRIEPMPDKLIGLKEFVIEGDAFKGLKSFLKGAKGFPIFLERDGEKFLTFKAGAVQCLITNASPSWTYPKTDQLWPPSRGEVVVSFNPRLMMELALALGFKEKAKTAEKETKMLTMRISTETHCAPVKLELGGQEGLLMPMRGPKK